METSNQARNPNQSFTLSLPLLLIPLMIKNQQGGQFKAQDITPVLNNIKNSLKTIVEDPSTVEMLNSVSQYLDESQKIPLQTLAGMLETVHSIKTLREGSYKVKDMPSLATTLNKQEKQIGILRSLKEYTEGESRQRLEQLEKMISLITEIQNNMANYSNELKSIMTKE